MEILNLLQITLRLIPVSYTHLDVYKRQLEWKWKNVFAMRFLSITLNYTHDSPKVLYGSSYDDTVERYISKEVNEHADNASAGFTPVSYTHLDVYKRQV